MINKRSLKVIDGPHHKYFQSILGALETLPWKSGRERAIATRVESFFFLLFFSNWMINKASYTQCSN